MKKRRSRKDPIPIEKKKKLIRLKDCPFCGSSSKMKWRNGISFASCISTMCPGSTDEPSWRMTYDEAVEAWNTRA